MKVFLAGATGVIGRRLVPQLIEAGHEVVGTTRSTAKVGELRAAGAEAAVVDPLDAAKLRAAVEAAEPDAIVHQLTALKDLGSVRNFDRVFAETNRLRTETTDVLLAAGREAGVTRFVAQSYAGWPYAKVGGPVKTEDDPLDPDPPAKMTESFAAIRHLERVVPEAGGLVLRYGGFYGPGTSIAPDGVHVELIRKRRFPIVGSGAGVWSFVHIDDAAAATLRALEQGAPGVYNVVDDTPAPAAEWLPELARIVGAPAPRRVPTWVGRLAGGDVTVSMMTAIRGASNAKAKRELDWRPRYPALRDGFAAMLEPAR